MATKKSKPTAAPVKRSARVRRPRVAAPSPTAGAAAPELPVVGVGASAGGLEALEAFLKHVPEASGMAFVVVQHLDPTRPGALVELLQRACRMPVAQARDRLRVEPDHVYVIPPNQDLSIAQGHLHLTAQTGRHGLNLPIDYFFRSLADDARENAVGVVLSGMGSDGTLGLRAIKERAGVTLAQSPSSAKFDSMPRSAIDAGVVDVVATVDQLPEHIRAYRSQARRFASLADRADEKARPDLEKILLLLRARTGNDFAAYKTSTVLRRIERRMGLHQIDKLAGYVRYLRENPHETDLLFQELLIGVTSFFRDPPAWAQLEAQVLPSLVRARAGAGALRAWVPGCSTGEEAYSLAIVLKEAVEKARLKAPVNLQIFATDLDRAAIDRARKGLYPPNIAADVSPERLRRFFVQDDHGFRVSKEIRECVVFAPQNVIMDPPFTKLDVLSCRNLLIYLSNELQKRLIPLFHYSLNPGGVLFLGSAETVGSFTGLFRPLDGKARVYRRVETTLGVAATGIPPSPAAAAGGAAEPRAELVDASRLRPLAPNLQVLADRVIVQRFAPAAVLTDDKGNILYLSGRTGKYLEPPVGKANLNVFAMAREGLRYELSSAFAAALRSDAPAVARGVRVAGDDGERLVDLTVQRLGEPAELSGMVMVVVAEARAVKPARPAPPARGHGARRAADLERELVQAREEIQSTREQMQSSQEELRSTNEELQSTNEELQSSNEELTTSKEEMQSMNEELQTVNQELQAKVDELSRSNNDMKNLLNSTDIATLFLDGDLHVRRFTTPTAKLIKLIPADAGRAITDIVADFEYPELAHDAREVLRTLAFKERHVATHDGHWYLVRIMPYRTIENVIDGLVITFSDATAAKQLEQADRALAALLENLSEALAVLDAQLRLTAFNPAAERLLGRRRSEVLGTPFLAAFPEAEGAGGADVLRRALRDGDPGQFTAALGRAPGAPRVAVRVRPHPAGVALFFGDEEPLAALPAPRSGP